MMYLHQCIGVVSDSFHRKRRGPLFGPILFHETDKQIVMLSYNQICMTGKSLTNPAQLVSFINTNMNVFCIVDRIHLKSCCDVLMLLGTPGNPIVFDRQCKWFSTAQELGQIIVFKEGEGTQTRRFFRKCVSVRCGASVQLKKSPRRYSNLGL